MSVCRQFLGLFYTGTSRLSRVTVSASITGYGNSLIFIIITRIGLFLMEKKVNMSKKSGHSALDDFII